MDRLVAIGYLAAMIDGEGTVGNRPRIVAKKWQAVRRDVSIANTDMGIINACIECCQILGIPHTIQTFDKSREKSHYKTVYTVNFASRQAFEKLIELPLRCPKKKDRLIDICGSYRFDPFDKEVLRRLYWEESKSFSEIAAQLGVKYGRIQHAFKTQGIEVRSLRLAVQAGWAKHSRKSSSV